MRLCWRRMKMNDDDLDYMWCPLCQSYGFHRSVDCYGRELLVCSNGCGMELRPYVAGIR